MKPSKNNIRLPSDALLVDRKGYSMKPAYSNNDLHASAVTNQPTQFSNSKMSGFTSLNEHLFISPLKHPLQDGEASLDVQFLKNENEQLKDKIKEMEKWMALLLNNFYEGNPGSLKNIEQALSKIDSLRSEKFTLKKALLVEIKKGKDMEKQFLDLKRTFKHREEEIIKEYEVGELVCQKLSLEQTLQSLTEEVECLSRTNQSLLSDLCKHDFYSEYHKICAELDQLKDAHLTLINTLKVVDQSPYFTINNTTSLGQQQQNLIKGKANRKESGQSTSTKDAKDGSFMSLISCNGGCSPSLANFQMPNKSSTKQLIQESPEMKKEQYEAMLSNQDINFLSALAHQNRIGRANRQQSRDKHIINSTHGLIGKPIVNSSRLSQKNQSMAVGSGQANY